MLSQLESFDYSPRRRPRGRKSGAHLSRKVGEEGLYAGSEPLLEGGRRFDLRATLLDPWQRLHVQRFQSRTQLLLAAAVDLSRSMARKRELLKPLVASIAYSAYRHHDRFTLWLATDHPHCALPPGRFGAQVLQAVASLEESEPRGEALEPLLEIAARLPREALVFLISDFFFREEELVRLARAFGHLDTVPVVVWSREERELPGGFGWLLLRDPERGEVRRLFLRPAVASRFRERLEQHRRQLEELWRSSGRPPLFLELPFSAKQLTRYFAP